MAGRRAPRPGTARQYPRTARLNRLLREILAEELELIDDERLDLLTLTSVDVDGGSAPGDRLLRLARRRGG